MIKRGFLKLFRKKIILDYHRYAARKLGHALLYYKTDPFVMKHLAKDYTHTNHWEILEMARILNRLGYWVDVLDRSIDERDIENLHFRDQYDIFFGRWSGEALDTKKPYSNA